MCITAYVCRFTILPAATAAAAAAGEIVYVPHAKRCINPLPAHIDLSLLNLISLVSIVMPQMIKYTYKCT